MYICELIIGISTFINIYQFSAFMGFINTPYLSSSLSESSLIILALKACLLKWAPVFSILGLFITLFDVFILRDKCMDYGRMRVSLAVFYGITGLLLLT